MKFLGKNKEIWDREDSYYYKGKGYLINKLILEANIVQYYITYKNGKINVEEKEDQDINELLSEPKEPKITFYKVNDRIPLDQLLQ